MGLRRKTQATLLCASLALAGFSSLAQAESFDYAERIKRTKAGGFGQTMQVSLGKYATPNNGFPTSLYDDLEVDVVSAPQGLRYRLDRELNRLTVYYQPEFDHQTFNVQLVARYSGETRPSNVVFTWRAGEDLATYQHKQTVADAYFPQISDSLWYDPKWLTELDHSDGVVLYKASLPSGEDAYNHVSGQAWTQSRAHRLYVQAQINRISECLLAYSSVSPSFQTQKWLITVWDDQLRQRFPAEYQSIGQALSGAAFVKGSEQTGHSHHSFSYTPVYIDAAQLDAASVALVDAVRETLKPQIAGYFEPRFYNCE